MPTWNRCPTLPSTRRGGSQMFRSLRERNAKLFFAGLAVSNIGTWLQATAQVLLVRQLGGNGVALGIVTACQFLPMLVIGLWAGALSDRFDRRRLTIITQAAMGVQAIVLGVLDLTNVVTIPTVYAMSLALGIIGAIDNPARRGLATELVERRNLSNVMSLNTSVMTGSRIFGPALAALFANVLGTGWCFMLNGVSFLALLWALVAIDPTRLYRNAPAPASDTPIRDGLRAVWADPVLRLTVSVYAIVCTFAFNYTVSIPLLIRDQLDAPDAMFGWILSVTSVGSVVGALMVARLQTVRIRLLFASVRRHRGHDDGDGVLDEHCSSRSRSPCRSAPASPRSSPPATRSLPSARTPTCAAASSPSEPCCSSVRRRSAHPSRDGSATT